MAWLKKQGDWIIKKLILAAIALILVTTSLQAAKNKYGFGGSIDKSLAVIGLEGYGRTSGDLIESTFSFFGNGVFKVNRKSYINFGIGYTSFSYNTNDYPGFSSNSFDLKLLGVTYFDKPDDFTPYIGYGGFISFITNDNPLIDNEDEYFVQPGLEEFLIALDGKFGFNIPLKENLNADVGIELKFYLSEYINFVPSLNAGVVYWLD